MNYQNDDNYGITKGCLVLWIISLSLLNYRQYLQEYLIL